MPGRNILNSVMVPKSETLVVNSKVRFELNLFEFKLDSNEFKMSQPYTSSFKLELVLELFVKFTN